MEGGVVPSSSRMNAGVAFLGVRVGVELGGGTEAVDWGLVEGEEEVDVARDLHWTMQGVHFPRLESTSTSVSSATPPPAWTPTSA